MSNETAGHTPPRERSTADETFLRYMARAERGGLFPEDFKALDSLRPHVSPELLNPYGVSE